MRRKILSLILFVPLAFSAQHLFSQTAGSSPATETIAIDAKAPATPFPHFWEEMFGSGRAELTMRDSYRATCARSSRSPDFNTSASTPSCTTNWASMTKTPGQSGLQLLLRRPDL
jgi:xylan 1,4-beta-xylosidase